MDPGRWPCPTSGFLALGAQEFPLQPFGVSLGQVETATEQAPARGQCQSFLDSAFLVRRQS